MTAISAIVSSRPKWQTVVIFAVGFWFSSSLLLDLVVMPGMYAAGMMTEPGFATAGYSIFWMFNRLEVLCAAIALTGALVLSNTQALTGFRARLAIALSLALLAIALTYTYGLTPTMSSLGLQLDLFNPVTEVPTLMNWLHQAYWMLELVKLGTCGVLLNLYFQPQH
jgi:Domain of unknown function (DUF4149)